MDKYIGVKLIEAEPCEGKVKPNYATEAGYKVRYPDGYESWSPKDVFEKAYMKVSPNPALPSGVSISGDMVEAFIKDIEYQKWGDKTTIAKVTLANGFVITESSSCVDAANFSMDVGISICREHIRNEVWRLLGFLLQTGVGGVKC